MQSSDKTDVSYRTMHQFCWGWMPVERFRSLSSKPLEDITKSCICQCSNCSAALSVWASMACPLVLPPNCPLTHPPTHPPIHPLIHSPTHSPTQPSPTHPSVQISSGHSTIYSIDFARRNLPAILSISRTRKWPIMQAPIHLDALFKLYSSINCNYLLLQSDRHNQTRFCMWACLMCSRMWACLTRFHIWAVSHVFTCERVSHVMWACLTWYVSVSHMFRVFSHVSESHVFMGACVTYFCRWTCFTYLGELVSHVFAYFWAGVPKVLDAESHFS